MGRAAQVVHTVGILSNGVHAIAAAGVQRVFSAKKSSGLLTLRVFFSILKNMKTATRERAKILAEMENIPFAVQGKICENRKPLANGGVGVYHNLQWWADGRNHAVHIPEARLEEFKRAVEGGKRVRELVYELSEASTQALLAAEPSTAKKKSTRSASRAARSSRR